MSDGRFSSKPIRSARNRDWSSNASAFSADALPASAGRDMLASPDVQREIHALIEQTFPDAGECSCSPLPKNTPHGAMGLGRPIASAILVQEYLIGLIFLRVCGWIFLLFGALIVLSGIIVMGEAFLGRGNPRQDPLATIVLVFGFGLGIGGAGAWFGFFRTRVVNARCWFCPCGVVWMTENVFDWYPWEEVPEVYCNLCATRPAVGIRFDRDIAWISFSNSLASRLTVDYIENRASAAWAQTTLQTIAAGRAVKFGTWRLSRSSIQSLSADFAWQDVSAVEQNNGAFLICHRQQGNMTVPLDEIPYPSLFVALSRAIFAYSRTRPA